MQINKIIEQLNALNEEEKSISEDQKRRRENVESLAKTAEAKQLIGRYIAKANDQESRIEAIGKERQKLKAEREQLESESAAAIRNFQLERTPN